MNPTSQSLHYRLASLCLIGILSLGLSGCVGAVAGVGAAAVAAGCSGSFGDGGERRATPIASPLFSSG